MSKIGPFFYINNNLIFHNIEMFEGEERFGKLDNPYSHEKLYDDYFRTGDYIDYPRGRVLWNKEIEQSIIYIDPCIDNKEVLEQIIGAFNIDKYVTASDLHYHCKNCSEAFLNEIFGD